MVSARLLLQSTLRVLFKRTTKHEFAVGLGKNGFSSTNLFGSTSSRVWCSRLARFACETRSWVQYPLPSCAVGSVPAKTRETKNQCKLTIA